MDKQFVNNGHKKFYNTGSWPEKTGSLLTLIDEEKVLWNLTQDNKNQIIMFTDSYDVIMLAGKGTMS